MEVGFRGPNRGWRCRTGGGGRRVRITGAVVAQVVASLVFGAGRRTVAAARRVVIDAHHVLGRAGVTEVGDVLLRRPRRPAQGRQHDPRTDVDVLLGDVHLQRIDVAPAGVDRAAVVRVLRGLGSAADGVSGHLQRRRVDVDVLAGGQDDRRLLALGADRNGRPGRDESGAERDGNETGQTDDAPATGHMRSRHHSLAHGFGVLMSMTAS